MNETKVFMLNDNEFWAGPSFFRVAKHYMRLTGLKRDEAFENPHEIGETGMQRLRVVDNDGEITGYPGAVMSFARALELQLQKGYGQDGKPFFFAGDEG